MTQQAYTLSIIMTKDAIFSYENDANDCIISGTLKTLTMFEMFDILKANEGHFTSNFGYNEYFGEYRFMHRIEISA